jgi:hypothetical protein
MNKQGTNVSLCAEEQPYTAERHQPAQEYNFAHFRPKHLFQDVSKTIRGDGIAPGGLAPDFELPRAGGGAIRLSDLRGKPVLLHFGSPS